MSPSPDITVHMGEQVVRHDRAHALRTLLVVLVAAGSSALLAQETPPDTQEPLPTFRTGIEAVQIDVFVTDAGGRPITDLTAGDFEVLEAGTPRPLVAFSRVALPVEPGHGPQEQWSIPSDVVTNDGPEGRLYIFALDEIGIVYSLRARAFLRRFLEEHFQPNDMAAVVLVGRGLVTSGHPFTSDPRLLLSAFDRFSGGFDALVQPCGERTSLTELQLARGQRDHPAVRSRMASLRQLTEQLAPLPGRKTMVYITQCIGFDMFDIVDYRGGQLSIAGDDAHAAMAAATRGNVVIYPIDPRGLTDTGGFEEMEARADLVAIASATGGFALSNSNNFTAAFERIVQDASAYYMLGFETAHVRRDGRYVRLEVRVNRPGARVRTRDGYVAPRGPAPPAREPAPPVLEALASPLAARGMALRVVATPFKGSGRDANVSLAVEIDTATLPMSNDAGMRLGQVQVSYSATDLRNRVHPGATHTIDVRRPADAPAAEAGRWMRIVSHLTLPPGQYQVRAAAGGLADAGSVVYDLEVPDFTRDPLAMSGLTITSASAFTVQTLRAASGTGTPEAQTCRPPTCVVPLATDGAPGAADPLQDALPGPPTAARAFDRRDTIALFAEIYTNARPAVAHTIGVTMTLRAEDGEVVAMATQEWPSTTPRRPSGGYGFLAQLALADIPPGRYVVHVDAQSDIGRGATASRAVPITVR